MGGVPVNAVDDAFERWAYGEGWSAGRIDGQRQGFEDGYTAGFDAGAEIGAARILLALQHRIPGVLDELLPDLPHTDAYAGHRRRNAWTDEPCPYGCGSCTRCVRAAAVATNQVRYGTADFPGRRWAR